MGVTELETELLKLIKEYNTYKKTYLIVYAAAILRQVPTIALSMDDYQTAFDLLRNVKSKNLDFYIETPGGSGEAAEEMVRLLRKKADFVSFVISGEAKSAGTIMALSGNDILMTESGSLGPIDAQVKIGRSMQSAYDYVDWVNEKRDEAQKKQKLNPFDATMIAQISPGELNGVVNSLNFAEDLVIEWLPKYKFKDWNITDSKKTVVTEKMKKDRAREIVRQLIDHNKWRSHGRSLKIDDLEKIGLKIKKIDDDSKLADIVYRIQTVIKMIFSTSNTFKLMATEEEKVFATASGPPIINSFPAKPPEMDVVELKIECQKCGNKMDVYGKLSSNPKIDLDLIKKGFTKFPSDNKLKCKCGFEIDVSGIRNMVENQIGKKLL